MFGIENYFAFLIAGILLNLTPGADTIYILTRSIAQGRRAGIYSVLGITSGSLIHTLFAAFGLSVILSTSAMIFNIIKYLGALYLCYLGIRMLLKRSQILEGQNILFKKNRSLQVYRQGLITNLFNPKVALFFLSFLPQFINTDNAYGAIPFLLLGATFITTGTIWCLVLAYSASFMTKLLRRNKSIGMSMQKLSDAVFIILGLKLALNKN